MGDLIDSILQGLFDVIFDVMQLVLDSFVGRLLYYAETGLCKIVGMLDEMFRVFAGIDKVSYDGEKDYLVNVFFNNRSITNVYWAMALIGIALAFGFTIAAVVRKMFDSSGKQQQSMSQILTSLVRTLILILGMSAIMVIILNSTNVLMQQVNLIFNDPDNLDLEATKVYTDEEFAAMGRVLNTIGNYSLNPSYSSRYNINTCFNEIRTDLKYLQNQKVFRYYYTTKDADGNEIKTWQSVLQKIANSHDLRTELKLDVSYDGVTASIIEAMDTIRNDESFRPLESYTRVTPAEGYVPLDRYLFLMGTMRAAKNNEYNINGELTDPVRGPYYSGEKNIYNISQVSKDFDIGFATDYLVVFLSGIALIFDLVVIILNCIARIFNMLFLYIIAPPIFAVQPYDGGGKTKQWMTAFIVQCFSVFGTVIAMRLLLIMLPIVTSSKLVLFENSTMNIMAKLVMIYGLFEVSKKATGLLTGILADSAGMQSIQAGDMSSSAGKMISGVTSAAKTVGKGAGKVLDFATKPAQNGLKRGWDKTGGKAVNAWKNLGKGDVAGDEAKAQAQKNIAVRDAEQKILAARQGGAPGGGGPGGGGPDGGGPGGGGPGGGGSGGGNDLPGSQGGGGSGGGNDLPGSQGGGGSGGGGSDGGGSGGGNDLPGSQGGGGGGGGGGPSVSNGTDASVPKAPPPPAPKSNREMELARKANAAHKAMSKKVNAQGDIKGKETGPKPLSARDRELAQKASAARKGMAGKVDAQGNMKKPESNKPEQTRQRMMVSGTKTGKGSWEAGNTGSRMTLGDKPEMSKGSKEAPASGKRPTMEQMERKADFRAATTSTHTSVGGNVSKGGSYTAESGGSRMSLKDTAPEGPRRSREAPTPSPKRISLDD